MNNESLVRRDLAVLWHPCTQMHDHETLPLVPIRRGEGVWLEDYEGKRYLDAISSWWVNLFGHANPRIAAALRDQVGQLEHVLLAGFTHAPALELAEALVRVTPAPLTRVFYADNGSAAVEVALKMSLHYWRNRGQSRKRRFVALSGGYHGETIGALSVGDLSLYRATYDALLFEPILVEAPDSFAREPGETLEAQAVRMAQRMERALSDHAEETCAVILEPLVQCAAGMRMHHPEYLRRVRALCDRFGVHLIADEIAVGFGRTGTLFACEQAGIAPDFLCLSKGLTGGFLPLSAVLTTEDVYAAFYGDYATQRAFLHSHSYTGNPLACRAALETLAIFADTDVLGANKLLQQTLARALEPLAGHPHVGEVRQTGMIAAVELVRDRRSRAPYPPAERRGLRVYRYGLERGVLLRPLGNVVYFMPPYAITPDEIELMVAVAREGIDLATV